MLLYTQKTLDMKKIYITNTFLQFNGFLRKWIVYITIFVLSYKYCPQPGRSLFVQHYEPGVSFCQHQISIS